MTPKRTAKMPNNSVRLHLIYLIPFHLLNKRGGIKLVAKRFCYLQNNQLCCHLHSKNLELLVNHCFVVNYSILETFWSQTHCICYLYISYNIFTSKRLVTFPIFSSIFACQKTARKNRSSFYGLSINHLVKCHSNNNGKWRYDWHPSIPPF